MLIQLLRMYRSTAAVIDNMERAADVLERRT